MIEITEDSDNTHAVTSDVVVTILPDGDKKAFKRRAIRKHLDTGETENIDWLVCELNGVRAYISGNNIIMTTRDLNP